MLYAVQAQRSTTYGAYSGSVQLPTFYLDSDVQGIVSVEHARSIAAHIVGPNCGISVYAVGEDRVVIGGTEVSPS